jgi:flagellar protein FliS
MTTPSPRNRYLADSVSTASPARLLLMLYDRLILDLEHAEEALRAPDRPTASGRLQSAQAIIMELRTALDVNAWDGAPALAALYGYLLTELIGANVRGDADRTATCRQLLEPLRDAWREAVLAEAGAAAAKSA